MALNTTGQCTRVSELTKKKNHGRRNKRTFNLLRICRTCIMRIYLLGRRALIEADEPVQEVVACGIVASPSLIVREIIFEG